MVEALNKILSIFVATLFTIRIYNNSMYCLRKHQLKLFDFENGKMTTDIQKQQ